MYTSLKNTLEFVVASINRESMLSKEKLEETFKLFDMVIWHNYIFMLINQQDGNGSISPSELKHFLDGANKNYSKELI